GTTGANPFNAVIWKPFEKGSPVQDLGVMNGPNSEGRAINAHSNTAGLTGTIVVPHAYFSIGKLPTVLEPMPGASHTFANALNDHGAIVGGAIMNQQGVQGQPALWHDGEWTGLGWLTGAHAGGARAINNLFQIGGSCTSSALGQRAFLWQTGSMHDINDLLVGTAAIARRVSGINDAGQILVEALLKGKTVAMRLAPIDRPVTDLNADCRTNVPDLMMLLEQWGPLPRNVGGGLAPTADFNRDGGVDVLDLLILLGNWG
ncbi:MAG TPA: hypothetical protein PK098_02720, partial [Phycisphaerales bacterium]|nr:hypothetical protein [Phycisphaerales bacterium]